MSAPLYLDSGTFRFLLERLGPSLALWRGAEIAALREQRYPVPVLDLGCGDGLVMRHLLPHVQIGLDPNAAALEQAAQQDLYGELANVPVQAAPFAPGTMATVASNSVLEHIPDIEGALQAIARLLQPGGKLIFTAPTERFSSYLALPLSSYAAWRNRLLEHLNLWTQAEWRRQLAAAGLEMVATRSYLRHGLVWLWDSLDLLQQMWIGGQRLFSLFWRRLSPATLDWLATRIAGWDLAATHGGGRLIVAQKRAQ